jgi:hypothetical protein
MLQELISCQSDENILRLHKTYKNNPKIKSRVTKVNAIYDSAVRNEFDVEQTDSKTKEKK